MLLETNSLGAVERSRSEAQSPSEARRRTGSATSTYSRVMDEVGAQDGNDRSAPVAKTAKPFSMWEKPEFSFGDFLDIINPLQHIPIVSTIYRNLSGDQIGAAPRVIGGALWGRVGGFVAGIINSVVEWFTGKDIGDHIYAAIWGNGPDAVAQLKDKTLPSGKSLVSATEPPLNSSSSTAAAADVAPEIETKVDADAAHSALAPTEIISSQFLRSFYRRVNEAQLSSDKPPTTVRLSA
jgi:hypothetical protein